jgi:8-oxo-dGTP pyrophosphatase MutT (NUDIX family)
MNVQFAVRIVQAHIAQYSAERAEWLHLVLRRSADEAVFPDIWQVVTGGTNKGETPLQTAFREIEEETGIVCGELWTLPFVGQYFDAVRNVLNFVPCFGAVAPEGTSARLSGEHSDYAWLPLEQLRRYLVIPSHKTGSEYFERSILQPIRDGKQPVFARSIRL